MHRRGHLVSLLLPFQFKCTTTVLSVAVIALLLLFATTSEAGWSGCINTKAPSDQQNSVIIQKPTIVCLSIGNRINWSTGAQYIRTNFLPTADEYSRFHLPNSYLELVRASNISDTVFARKNITISVASLQQFSYLRVYYDVTAGRVFPFLTAIINVHRGTITGITWDNACVFCSGFGNKCIPNTYNYNGVQQTQSSAGQPTQSCYFTVQQCEEFMRQTPNTTACDITLYVVWSGSDYNNIAFQSQQYRFSAFPPQQLTDRITQLLNPYQLTADDVTPNILEGNKSDATNNTRRIAVRHFSL